MCCVLRVGLGTATFCNKLEFGVWFRSSCTGTLGRDETCDLYTTTAIVLSRSCTYAESVCAFSGKGWRPLTYPAALTDREVVMHLFTAVGQLLRFQAEASDFDVVR